MVWALASSPTHAQAWSGVLSPSRAIDWSAAGLPATFPDGETTPNPWTPPTRSQSGSTLVPSGADDTSQINSAFSSCNAGHFVSLGSGTFKISSALSLSGAKNCSLRGSGAQTTKLAYTSTNSQINIGLQSGTNSASVTGINSSTSITISGTTPPLGPIWIDQCDTGLSGGAGCTNGTQTDNGGVFVCGNVPNCANQGASTSIHRYEEQIVTITNITGTCSSSCILTFNPPLFMPDWSTSRTPMIGWNDTQYTAVGIGFEDMTIDFTNGTSSTFGGGFQMGPAYASWVKGVRFVGANNGGNSAITIGMDLSRSLFSSNYIFQVNPISGSSLELTLGPGGDSGLGYGVSSTLFLNNTIQGGQINSMEMQGMDSGNVYAYNFFRDESKTQVYNCDSTHEPFPDHELREGNQIGCSADDLTWTTHMFNTWFRNSISCNDAPFSLPNPRCITIDSLSRFENVIGNAVGGTGISTYIDTSSGTGGVYSIGVTTIAGTGSRDPLAQTTLMLWGNYDTVNATTRFVASEVPTSLTGAISGLSNLLPLTNALPASFFMNSATAHPSGGTGLTWWNVCVTWATFPTACAGSKSQPFPTTGPDVTGGPYLGGHSYDNPAALAWKNLPIDTAYQEPYTVTGSSWSNGTETLTVSGLPNDSSHLMGGFQLSGMNTACAPTSGVSFTGRSDSEFLMTGSSGTTVSYAIAANPGTSCTGTLKWPDIRQFDERVFQTDGSIGPPQGASGLGATAH
jgi:hypothetical protein